MSTIKSYQVNGSPYETLIQSMLTLERQPQQALKTQKGDLDVFRAVLTDFDKTLSALHSSLKALTDPVTNPFGGRTTSVPAGAGFAAKATDKAAAGTHTLQVTRLATADARVSDRHAAAGSSLATFFGDEAKAFTIRVAQPTADDPDARVDVAVSVNPTGATDGEILEEVNRAIASAMDAAVEAGTLQRANRPQASVVRETSDTARLQLRSGQTGYQHRLAFDDPDGLLGQLGLTNTDVATGTAGGPLAALGTGEEDSALNAQVVLNGLTLVRPKNTVDDALTGVTLTLNAVDDAPRTFEVKADEDGAAKKVEDFIAKYNAVVEYLTNKTKVDGEKGTRNAFSGDATIASLRYGLRTDARATVAAGGDAPDSLAALGITVERDGKLKLGDKEKLLGAVRQDPAALQKVFADEAGVGAKMMERLDGFVGAKGSIKQRQDITDAKIKQLGKRITGWDDKMARREEVLRMQYARLQETLAQLQGQQDAFLSFLSY